MFNHFLGGLASGGGSGGGGNTLPPAGNGVTFNEVEATADFANQLGPPPADVITQTQGKAQTAGNIPAQPAPPGVGGGTNPPPPPPQQAGMGGGQQPTGEAAYSGIDSVIQKLGGQMYDPATIQAERGHAPSNPRQAGECAKLHEAPWLRRLHGKNLPPSSSWRVRPNRG